MGEITLWAAWFAGATLANVYDPFAWVVFAVAILFAGTRPGLLISLSVTMALVATGTLLSIENARLMGRDAVPPTVVAFHLGKLVIFALGVALNRAVQRIEKRFTGVLEKARAD